MKHPADWRVGDFPALHAQLQRNWRMVGCVPQPPGEAWFAWWFQKGVDGDNKYHLLTRSPGAVLTTGVEVPRTLGLLTKQAFMKWLALH